MNLITVSREFGSGGRELGKCLADLFGCDYYDREIITAIADSRGLDEQYVEQVLDSHGWKNIPIRYGRSFRMINSGRMGVDLLVEQKRVIEKIGAAGKDCVIVGRNADLLLAEYQPFRIFVCADSASKLKRCRMRSADGENLSDKELSRKIKEIDRVRAQSRDMIGGTPWGQRENYHLTVNTGGWEIQRLAAAVAEFVKLYFGRV